MGLVMGSTFQFQVLFQSKIRRWLFVMAVVAVTHLIFQSFLLPYGDALRSLLPGSEVSMGDPDSFLTIHSSTKSVTVRYPLAVNDSRPADASVNVGLVEENTGKINTQEDIEDANDTRVTGREGDTSVESEDGFKEDSKLLGINENDVRHENITKVPVIKVIENNSTADINGKSTDGVHLEQVVKGNIRMPANITHAAPSSLSLPIKHSNMVENSIRFNTRASPTTESLSDITHPNNLLLNGSRSDGLGAPKKAHNASKNESVVAIIPVRKKIRCNMPPKSVTTIKEMNHIYLRHRASSRAMRPRWSSARDQEILAARVEIQNAPVINGDKELYAPLFRNISQFKKSYELMERILKVYVYKDGKKPIFHQPIMKGLYASEGWFMKLMEGNRQFVVKDPRKAHLFYMPFSSRMLEYTIYVRNSHNRTNLRQYLKEYTDQISAKYPFFKRTGGADHFLVACHDWAPYETRHHMERCIKALCNADVTAGFKIGRDVSLPETYVRSARNPLRDLGGKPASKRHILAFYAGNLHGYLRPILLKHWEDKDPDMKIFGPMPPGVASKMNYIHHMKSSKYCICPKGYEVNSPRVVEAIFYECVPVIISDNFVPPFFEVLDWGSFSLILAEKDIPNLKNILLSIPEDKYREMQFRVRKVQRHFLWHAKPLKYDLFYMTLHSIWYNRVFQIKPR